KADEQGPVAAGPGRLQSLCHGVVVVLLHGGSLHAGRGPHWRRRAMVVHRVRVSDPEWRSAAPYFSSASTPCGIWLACATMAVPACCRIWVRVRLAVSAAKSASRMRERDADMFSDVMFRLAMLVSKRDWRAPSLA